MKTQDKSIAGLKMRVAFCHHYKLSFCGGGERWIVEAANFLRYRGHVVDVYCLPFRGGNYFPPLRRDIRYHESWFHRFDADVAYYVYAPVVTKLFKTDAPKILGLHAVLHSSLTEKVNNPYLFYKRYGPYVTIANFLQSHLLKNGFSDFDALHWISPAEPFLKHRNIYQIPNWVDTESFNKRKDEKKEFCVLFLGRQTYAKGFDRFLETARLLKNQISFISTGKTVENIKGLGFFPYASLNSLYSKASVVISPTRDDSFGITIVESLAAGVPVITTPLLSHTSLSLPLLYAESPSEIAAKVKELYALWKNDKEKYDHICRLGIESAKKYDAKTALPRIEQMLLEVSKR